MADLDDDYLDDLQPLRDELAALRSALGDEYQGLERITAFDDNEDEDDDEDRGRGGPSIPAALQDASTAAVQDLLPIPNRFAAVSAALEANRTLQQRLRRLLQSISRALQQANAVRLRAQTAQRNRQTEAAAPRAQAARKQQEQYTGLSWYWPQPIAAPPPPPYPGSNDLKAVARFLPLVFPKRTWMEDERRSLCDGVLQVVQELRINDVISQFEVAVSSGAAAPGGGGAPRVAASSLTPEDFEQRQAPIKALTIASPEVAEAAATFSDAHWATVAHRSAPGRSGLDCKLYWLHYARPGLSHTPFTPAEDKQLLELVERHGTHAWTTIAAQLDGSSSGGGGGGTMMNIKRTALACMSRHQRLLHQQRGTQEFTEADKTRLFDVVKRVGKLSWRTVAEEFGGPWDGDQLMHHYRRHVQRLEGGEGVVARKGTWSREEDGNLLKAVALHGKKWSFVALMIPGRSDVQCRERYVNCLDPSIKKNVPWSAEEDEKLEATVAALKNEHPQGNVKWGAVAKVMEGRSDSMCAARWRRLSSAQSRGGGGRPRARRIDDNDGGALGEESGDGERRERKKTKQQKRGGGVKRPRAVPSTAAEQVPAEPEPEKYSKKGRSIKTPSRFVDFE